MTIGDLAKSFFIGFGGVYLMLSALTIAQIMKGEDVPGPLLWAFIVVGGVLGLGCLGLAIRGTRILVKRGRPS